MPISGTQKLQYMLVFCLCSYLVFSSVYANSCNTALKTVANDNKNTALDTLHLLQQSAITLEGTNLDHEHWRLYIDQYITKITSPRQSVEVDFSAAKQGDNYAHPALAEIYQKLQATLGKILFGHGHPVNEFIEGYIHGRFSYLEKVGLYAVVPSFRKKNPTLIFLLLLDRKTQTVPTMLWVAKIDNASQKVLTMEKIIMSPKKK